MDNKDIDSGFNLCLNYLLRSIKTKKQIRDYLYKKQFDKEMIDQIVDKLEEYNFLDDKNFAGSYINSYKLKGKSRAEIKLKLLNKGISREIVDEALQNELSDEDETEYAVKLIKKYYTLYIDENIDEEGRIRAEYKIKSKLYQRGFKVEVINRAWDNYFLSNA